jgi:hypothetical protein
MSHPGRDAGGTRRRFRDARHVNASALPIARPWPIADNIAGAEDIVMAYHVSAFRTESSSRKAMAFAIDHPDGSHLNDKEKGGNRAWRTMLWRCRVVLRYSRELAERVRDGSIPLQRAFNEARPPQPLSQDTAAASADTRVPNKAPTQKTRPSLPTLKSLRAPVDNIAPTELGEFLKVFAAPVEQS